MYLRSIEMNATTFIPILFPETVTSDDRKSVTRYSLLREEHIKLTIDYFNWLHLFRKPQLTICSFALFEVYVAFFG
jgi:hypothetical protein